MSMICLSGISTIQLSSSHSCHKNKSKIQKKKKKKRSKLCFTTRKNRLSLHVDEKRLESFMKEVPVIQKPVHRFAEQMIGPVSIRQEPPS